VNSPSATDTNCGSAVNFYSLYSHWTCAASGA